MADTDCGKGVKQPEPGIRVKIEAKQLIRRFDDYLALDRVSLEVEDGELVALLGPSGSGKTTLLRLIGGLDYPDSGSVLFQGRDATQLPIQQRRVGFVFQHYALFRHMTVFKNIAFGLEILPFRTRPTPAVIRSRVRELLRLVQLDGFENRLPAQLSGGQRQRIALARALAIDPRILLLDEPFGALDAKVRHELRAWLRSLQRELKITTLFVTHDQEEALELADRVVVMNNARIEQIGTPVEISTEPSTTFVADFLRKSSPTF
jgi:sulfate/thiosulfate transport system ATP-binding protein